MTTELVLTLDMLCQYWHTDLKNEETPVFSMWGYTSQLLTDKSNKICVVLLSRMVFALPGWWFWVFLLCDKTFRSFTGYLQAWWESFGPYRITETAFAWCKHQLKPTSARKPWAAEIPRSYNMFTRVAISVNPSTDSIKPHQTPSDHLFSISNPARALCMIKSIYKGFASCRCCHKSPVGPASATGCLTNVPQ